MTIAHADTIAGLVKGLAVLESFDTERQRLNATLAALPRAELSAWLKGRVLRRITAHTVTAPRAFRAVLAQVAEQDYCVATDEHELGVHAVAVPLRRRQGQTVAALNVVLAPGRLNDALLTADILPRLREAAGEIRQLL